MRASGRSPRQKHRGLCESATQHGRGPQTKARGGEGGGGDSATVGGGWPRIRDSNAGRGASRAVSDGRTFSARSPYDAGRAWSADPCPIYSRPWTCRVRRTWVVGTAD